MKQFFPLALLLFATLVPAVPSLADGLPVWERRFDVEIDQPTRVMSELGPLLVAPGKIEIVWAEPRLPHGAQPSDSELLAKGYLDNGVLLEPLAISVVTIPAGTRVSFSDPLRTEGGYIVVKFAEDVLRVGGIPFGGKERSERNIFLYAFDVAAGTGGEVPVQLIPRADGKIRAHGHVSEDFTIQGWNVRKPVREWSIETFSFEASREDIASANTDRYELLNWSLNGDQMHRVGAENILFRDGDELLVQHSDTNDPRPYNRFGALQVITKTPRAIGGFQASERIAYDLVTGKVRFFDLAVPAVLNGIELGADCKPERWYYMDYIVFYSSGVPASVCPKMNSVQRVNGRLLHTNWGYYPVHFWENGQAKMIGVSDAEPLRFTNSATGEALVVRPGSINFLFFSPEGVERLALINTKYYEIRGALATEASEAFVNEVVYQPDAKTFSFDGPSPLLEGWLRAR